MVLMTRHSSSARGELLRYSAKIGVQTEKGQGPILRCAIDPDMDPGDSSRISDGGVTIFVEGKDISELRAKLASQTRMICASLRVLEFL